MPMWYCPKGCQTWEIDEPFDVCGQCGAEFTQDPEDYDNFHEAYEEHQIAEFERDCDHWGSFEGYQIYKRWEKTRCSAIDKAAAIAKAEIRSMCAPRYCVQCGAAPDIVIGEEFDHSLCLACASTTKACHLEDDYIDTVCVFSCSAYAITCCPAARSLQDRGYNNPSLCVHWREVLDPEVEEDQPWP